MDIHLDIEEDLPYQPFRALLVYSNGRQHRATVHDLHEVRGQPELGAASPLTTHDLAAITAHLGARHLTFHPEQVIASSSAVVVWWERARERPLFFAGQDDRLKALNGQAFPQPPLLLIARPRSLSVFALAENARPGRDTRVCRSPYYNVYADGRVCVGSVTYPNTAHGENTLAFSHAFFQSNFTHNSGNARLTAFEGSHAELWQHVQDLGHFPAELLVPLEQTVAEVVR